MKPDHELDRTITEEERIKLEILGERMGWVYREVSDYAEMIMPHDEGIPNLFQRFYIKMSVWFSELVCNLYDILGVKKDREATLKAMRTQRDQRLKEEQERYDKAAQEAAARYNQNAVAADPRAADQPKNKTAAQRPALSAAEGSAATENERPSSWAPDGPDPADKKAEAFLALAKEWAAISGPLPEPLDFSVFEKTRRSRLPFETSFQSLGTSGQSEEEEDGGFGNNPFEISGENPLLAMAEEALKESGEIGPSAALADASFGRDGDPRPWERAPKWHPPEIEVPWHTDVYADYLRYHGRTEELEEWLKQRDWIAPNNDLFAAQSHRIGGQPTSSFRAEPERRSGLSRTEPRDGTSTTRERGPSAPALVPRASGRDDENQFHEPAQQAVGSLAPCANMVSEGDSKLLKVLKTSGSATPSPRAPP